MGLGLGIFLIVVGAILSFTNLIDNSLKYAPTGSTIVIEARQADDETLHVQVRNQGPPVAPEHLDHPLRPRRRRRRRFRFPRQS